MARMASEPYTGPLVVFTTEELDYIQRRVKGVTENPGDKALQQSVLDKIQKSNNSDPKWRLPPP